MGSVIGKAANDLGGVLGHSIGAPLKSIFGGSCDEICSGPWDVVCFIEHFCISSLAKFFMILVLCYIMLLFFYLLFKLGICQCIGRSFCKMCWGACKAYWFSFAHITCFMWRKLLNTKRINRRRRRHLHGDIELGFRPVDDETEFSVNYSHFGRKPRSTRRRRKDHLQKSLHLSKRNGSIKRHRYRHARLDGRSQRLHSSRKFPRYHYGRAGTFKRRRIKR